MWTTHRLSVRWLTVAKSVARPWRLPKSESAFNSRKTGALLGEKRPAPGRYGPKHCLLMPADQVRQQHSNANALQSHVIAPHICASANTQQELALCQDLPRWGQPH